MNQDPFYQAIVDKLPLVTDGNEFERCVTSLLSKEWPNLLPVPGGQDSGLDGAFVDDSGHGLLVATIRKDVIGNVTKNLKKHLADGGLRRRVLVATTQALTPRRCQNIEKRIRKLGFQVAHYPYTQVAIAERLYRDSRWCRELLRISSNPPALSRIPIGLRPLRDLPLLHREEDLHWLQSTAGDKVIIGHPGIGKTYLLQSQVNSGGGLFVADDDLGKITAAIRDQQPSAVFIEDAHLKTELLNNLRRYRIESGLVFNIVADCWPAAKQQVCQALSVSEINCRELKPFQPSQIVNLIHSAGIGGPPALLHQLVNQSGGYPGRVAMLCHVCTTQDVREAWDGRALTRWVHATFEKLVSERSLQILAAFSIGGNAGMKINAVASVLGYPAGEIRECMSKLAFGGVVQDLGNDCFCVVPTPLRCVLVKNYFFDSKVPLQLDEFLDRASSIESVFSTLLGALSRGAAVPNYVLIDMFRNSHGSDVWEEFVWADPTHAKIVLERFPSRVTVLAGSLLLREPDRMVPKLLQSAVGDDRPLHSTPNHPLRTLKDWVESAPQATGEAVQRRRVLWKHVKASIAKGDDPSVSLACLKIILSPSFNAHESIPGNPHAFNVSFGSIVPKELREIADLWSEVKQLLMELKISNWSPIFEAVDEWVYWRHHSRVLEEHRSIRNDTAIRMLTDLFEMCNSRPGMQMEIIERATTLGLQLEGKVNEEFALLFPHEKLDKDWEEKERQQGNAVKALASDWSKENASVWSKRLMSYVREARASGHMFPDYSGHLCNVIASTTNNALSCLDELIENQADSHHLLPFARRVLQEKPLGWEERFRTCNAKRTWHEISVRLILPAGDIHGEILTEAIEVAKSCPKIVEILCRHNDLPADRIQSLLAQDDPNLSEATAIGLWHSEPTGHIEEIYLAQWRASVVAHVHQEYHLNQMIGADPHLAFMWLHDRATIDRPHYYDELYTTSANQLNVEQRKKIIDALQPDCYHARPVIKALVGNSSDIFRHLLSKDLPSWVHMSPLTGTPDQDWCELAKCALTAGYSAADLMSYPFSDAPASFGTISSRFESELEVWQSLSSNDPQILEAINLAKTIATQDLEKWTAQEKLEEFNRVYG